MLLTHVNSSDCCERFHPAINRVKEIVDSGELGKIKSIYGGLRLPIQMKICSYDDIRCDYNLGGGMLMDLGCKLLTSVVLTTTLVLTDRA